MTLSAGDRLGRYEILGPIGAGGMGEVWRALDTELDRQVAVKVLPESFASDENRLERFQREAKALAALSHPNLLDIYDVGATDGIHFAVTELLEGDTLRERIARPATVAEGDLNRRRRGRRPRRGPRPRDHPPRHQTRKPLHHRRRPGQDPRLRTRGRPRGGRYRSRDGDHHRGRHRHGHPRLHGPRAGQGQAGRRPLGHLLARLRHLRDGIGPPRLLRRHRGRGPRRHPQGGAAAAVVLRRRGAGGSGTGGPPLSREAPRGALPVGRGSRLQPQERWPQRNRACHGDGRIGR